MYNPLPESLTIKTSKVNGLGLFAEEDIAQGTNFGMTHLKIGDMIFRTPLGGFINHSNTPNCDKAELRMTNEDITQSTNLGMTHLKIGDTIFSTPLGGFIHHSDTPNCDKAELRMTNEDLQGHQYSYKKWNLITGQNIKKGKELKRIVLRKRKQNPTNCRMN